MNCPKCGEDWSDVAVVRNAKREALAETPAPLDMEWLVAVLHADASDDTRETMWRYGIRHALALIRQAEIK